MSELSQNISASELWESAKASMASVLSKETFASWFADLQTVSFSENTLCLSAKSEFTANWIKDNYGDILRMHLSLSSGCNTNFKIDVDCTAEELALEAPAQRTVSRISVPEKLAAAPLINPRNTFENYVVGDGNKLAHAAALAVAESPGSAFNPLCLYGATGLGKTHLMHAIAHFIFKNNPRSRIVYLSSERFVNEFINAIKDNNIVQFRARYRDVDVLMVDDVQFFAGKDRCQTEFFHAFNDLFNEGKQIILSSDRPVSEIKDIEQRLISRFEWGMPIDIQPPDYETRYAILLKKAKSMSVELPAEVIDLLARKITKNVRRMEGALNILAGFVSLVAKNTKPLDLATAEKLLGDTFMQEESSSQISVELIQKKTADYLKIDVSEMIGPRRPANVVNARQIAMYLSRKLTTHSLQELGQMFGGRTHGAVMHAISSIENTMEQDESSKRTVDYLLKTISH